MIWIVYYAASFLLTLYFTAHLTWKLWTNYLSSFEFADNAPWLGIIPYLEPHPRRLFLKIAQYIKKHNHLYVTWHGPKAEITLGRAEYAKVIMSSQKCLNKHGLYGLFSEWLGDGILLSSNEKWKKRRALLTPAFHITILQDNVEIYERNAMNLVRYLRAHVNTSKAIDIQELVSLATLDVVCETSMGVRMNALDCESKYVNAIKELKVLFVNRLFSPLLHSKFIYKLTSRGKRFYKHLTTLQKFTIDVINKRIEERSKKGSTENGELVRGKRALLDILLDLYDRGEIDVEGIIEEVDTFIFAGHDTTATTLSWTFFSIATYPDIQERIYDEIRSISENDCSFSDKIRDLKYTECVIKETMRRYPAVPFIGRTTKEELKVNEHIIPKGTDLSVNIYALHHNPAYWDDPFVFNPNRFMGKDSLERNPFSYVPFSAGPRGCIGQRFAMLEMKVFIYHLISSYRIEATQSEAEVEPCFSLTSESFNGIYLNFFSRQEGTSRVVE